MGRGHAYRPVQVRHIFAVEYARRKPGAVPKKAAQVPAAPATSRNGSFLQTGRVREYWQAFSKLLGECGHKHKSESSAEPCLRRMKAEWSARHSKQAKKSWISRMASQRLEGIGAVLVD